MFKNISELNDILRMLKYCEGVNPSIKEFVEVIKDNPRILEVYRTPRKYFKEGAVMDLAYAIHKLRNSSK